jgi:uncharacterized protein YndB with AHSA1/START domain/predicted enzyme related to lactoylglutathione lyase
MPREIRDEIEIAAPRERVFACLTDPRELVAWWTSFDYPATKWELDARPGGAWRSYWRGPDGAEFSLGGEIVEIRAPEVLEYTWRDDRYPNLAETRVRYEIDERPGGCRVRLRHTGFDETRVDFDDYNGGWLGVFGKLRLHASGESEFRSNRDVAIEVPDLARARAFYVDGLGFTTCSESPTHLEVDTGVIRLWIKSAPASRSFMPSLDVRDVSRARSIIRTSGGRILEGDTSDDGFVFADPFGNVIDVVRASHA